MIHTPKDMTKDVLDTAIVLVIKSNFKIDHLNNDLRAKKRVLVYEEKYGLRPTHRNAFDVIEPISKVSYEEIRDVVKAHVGNKEKTRLVYLGEDDILPVARIREELGIPGATLKELSFFLNKTMQMERMKKHNVRVPKGTQFEKEKYQKDPEAYATELEEEIGFPMFVKPSNGVCSQGIMNVENHEHLRKAFEMMNQAESVYLIQEFITGTMYGIDVAVINGEAKLICPFVKGNYVGDMKIGKPNLSMVLQSTDPIYQKMVEYTKRVIKAFENPPDSWANIEVFYTEKEEIVYCETNYRRTGSMVLHNILYNVLL